MIKKKKEEEEDKLLWGPRNGGTAQEQVILCPYQRNVPWTWYFLTSNIAREGSQTRLIPSLDQKGQNLSKGGSLRVEKSTKPAAEKKELEKYLKMCTFQVVL